MKRRKEEFVFNSFYKSADHEERKKKLTEIIKEIIKNDIRSGANGKRFG